MASPFNFENSLIEDEIDLGETLQDELLRFQDDFLYSQTKKKEENLEQQNLQELLNLQKQILGESETQETPSPVREGPPHGLAETALRATQRGFSRLSSTIFDLIPALGSAGLAELADITGLDSAAKVFREYTLKQLNEGLASEEEIDRMNPAEFRSYKEVSSPAEALRFAFQVAPEQIANMGAVLATAAATKNPFSAIASGFGRKALMKKLKVNTEKELKDKITSSSAAKALALGAEKKAVTRGLMAASGLGSFALNAPEVFNNVYQETGKLAPGMALLGGAVAASLDSVLPYQIAKSFIRNPALKKEVVRQTLLRSGGAPSIVAAAGLGAAKGLGRGILTEGPTEGGQEGVSIIAERIVSDNWEAITSEESDRIIESAVQGAVGGGGISSVSGTLEGGLSARDKALAKEALNKDRELFSERANAEELQTLIVPSATVAQRQRFADLGLTKSDVDYFGASIEPDKDGRYTVGQLNSVLLNKHKAREATRTKDIDTEVELHRSVEGSSQEKERLVKEQGYGFEDAKAITAFEEASKDPETQLNFLDLTDQSNNYIANREPGTPAEDGVIPNLFSAEEIQGIAASKKALVEQVTPIQPLTVGEQTEDVNAVFDRANILNKTSGELLVEDRQKKAVEAIEQNDQILAMPDEQWNTYDPTKIEGERLDYRDLGIPDEAAFFEIQQLRESEPQRANKVIRNNPDLLAIPKEQWETYNPTTVEGATNDYRNLGIPDEATFFEVQKIKETGLTFDQPQTVEEAIKRSTDVEAVNAKDGFDITAREDLTNPEYADVLDGFEEVGASWNTYRYSQTEENLKAVETARDNLLKLVVGGAKIPPSFRNTLATQDGKFTPNFGRFLANSSVTSLSPIRATTVDRVNGVINETFPRNQELTDRITVVRRPSDVGRTDVGPRTQGLITTDGEIFLFTDNIEVGNELGVLMHEAGVHLGLFNTKTPQQFKQLHNAINRFAKEKDTFRGELARFAKKRVELANTPQESVVSETIAYFVEEAVNRGVTPTQEIQNKTPLGGFFRNLVKLFKQILRSLRINISPTPQEFVDMAYGAARLPLKRPAEKLNNIERELFSVAGLEGLSEIGKGKTGKWDFLSNALSWTKRGLDKGRFYFTELPLLSQEVEDVYKYNPNEELRIRGKQLAGEIDNLDRLNNARLYKAQVYLEGASVVTYRTIDGEERRSTPFNYTERAEEARQRLLERLRNDANVDQDSISTIKEGWFIPNVVNEGQEVISELDKLDLEENFILNALEASRLQTPFYKVALDNEGNPTNVEAVGKNKEDNEYFEAALNARIKREKGELIQSLRVYTSFARNFEQNNLVGFPEEPSLSIDELRAALLSTNMKVDTIDTLIKNLDPDSLDKDRTFNNATVNRITEEAITAFDQRGELRLTQLKKLEDFFGDLFAQNPELANKSIVFLHKLEDTYKQMFKTLQSELAIAFGAETAQTIMSYANIDPRLTLNPYLPLTRDGEFRLVFTPKDKPAGEIYTVRPYKTYDEAFKAQEALKNEGTKSSIQALPEKKGVAGSRESLDVFKKELEKTKLNENERESVATLIDEIRSRMLPLTAFQERTRERRGVPGYDKKLIEPLLDISNAMANQLAAFIGKSALTESFDRMDYILEETKTIAVESEKPEDATFMKDIKAELDRRRKYMENPVNARWANVVASNTFRYYLALNPSSSIVNTTSAWTLGLGILGSEYGGMKAINALRKASGVALQNIYKGKRASGRNTDSRLADRTLFNEDVVDNQEYASLFSYALLSGAIRSAFNPDIEKVAPLEGVGKKNYHRSLWTFAGWMFQQSERMSREVVLKAAYDLERNRQKNMSEKGELDQYLRDEAYRYERITAADIARGELSEQDQRLREESRSSYDLRLSDERLYKKGRARTFENFDTGVNGELAKEVARRRASRMVYRIQSTGIRASGSRALQSNFGKVFGSLRSYAMVMMTFQWSVVRDIFRGASVSYKRRMKGEKFGEEGNPAAAALKMWTYTSVPTFLLAGMQGIPVYYAFEIMFAFTQALGGDDEFEPDENLDQFVMNSLGVSWFLGPFGEATDMAIHRRVGFNDLLIQDDPYKEKRMGLPGFLAASVAGAGFSILSNAERGLSYAREGDYTRAASSVLPRAVSNVIVGASPNYGFSNKGDRLIDDVDAKDRLTKMIGFGNTQSQVNRLRRQRMFNNKNKASDRKQAILFQANMERTAANMISSETREAAKKFNQSGFSKIKGVGAITNDSFKRSWSAWNKRRRTAEYAFERYNITYPGLTYEEVDTLARQLGLDTTMNLDIF